MKSVFCCGMERGSPFCGECGKKLVAHDLHSLLAHVRDLQRKNETLLRRSKENTKRAERWGKIVAKWKAWGDQLEALLKEAAS